MNRSCHAILNVLQVSVKLPGWLAEQCLRGKFPKTPCIVALGKYWNI